MTNLLSTFSNMHTPQCKYHTYNSNSWRGEYFRYIHLSKVGSIRHDIHKGHYWQRYVDGSR